MSRPTVHEIAALTARLRELSNAGRDADPAEVDRFLTDKRELLDRITADPREPIRDAALIEVARARAAQGGYAFVGPSARTWRTDPTTGEAVEPVSEAEHHAVRDLLVREEFSSSDPKWVDNGGRTELVSTVIPAIDDDTAAAVRDAHTVVTGCLTRAEPTVDAAHVDEEPVVADEAGFW